MMLGVMKRLKLAKSAKYVENKRSVRIAPFSAILSIATPWVIEPVIDTTFSRILVNVANDGHQVFVRFDRFALETALEHRSNMPVNPVEVTGIARLKPVHEFVEPFEGNCCKKVEMVAHETPCEQCPTLFIKQSFQLLHEESTICVVLENYLFTSTSIDYVING